MTIQFPRCNGYKYKTSVQIPNTKSQKPTQSPESKPNPSPVPLPHQSPVFVFGRFVIRSEVN